MWHSNRTESRHWHVPHDGEHRFPVTLIAFIVIVLQFLLPDNLSLPFQKWVCILEVLLLTLLFATGPKQIAKHHSLSRNLGVTLTSVMTVSNTASAIKLIHSLVTGGIDSATQLLASGGSIWLTNIVIFSLWFWDLDRGGPGARAGR